jgi:lysophospholipase L1-like esterase
MKTDVNVIRVLCFGDSNTWGRSGSSRDRYLANQRWTGLLQEKLGSGYEILEEGLRSRTTDLDDDDPQFPNRDGKEYLRPSLESQYPTDIVVLWLGTNDLKSKYNRTPEQIAQALSGLVEMILDVGKTSQNITPSIILVSPPIVKEEVLKVGSQFEGAGEKSKKLPSLIREVATQQGCTFVDLAEYVEPGDADGVHLELESHPKVAAILFEAITKIK